MTDNLAIWNALFKTDPKHVKPITGKSYNGNSPKPQYIIYRLTEVLGPVGVGFGWSVQHEAYIDGKPHQDGTEKMHECRIEFWWRTPGDEMARNRIESYGCTKALYKARQGYWVDDEDAAKKSLTDAIVKAASWLGAAGDIFMGRWDDSKYQAELREEFSPANKAKRETRAFPKDVVTDHPKDEPRTANVRPVEPPHDPVTGEITDERNPPPPAAEPPVDHSRSYDGDSANLAAWKDGILDKLPASADTEMKARALWSQFVDDLDKYKAEKWLGAYVESRRPVLNWWQASFPDLFESATLQIARAYGRIRGEDLRDYEPIMGGEHRIA